MYIDFQKLGWWNNFYIVFYLSSESVMMIVKTRKVQHLSLCVCVSEFKALLQFLEEWRSLVVLIATNKQYIYNVDIG